MSHTHDDRYYTESETDTKLVTKAPTSHASTATTYGIGNASNYGHVKVSDNYTSSAGAAAAGVSASSKAVHDAYNTARASRCMWFSNSDADKKHMNIVIDYSTLGLVGFQIMVYKDVYIITCNPGELATGSIGTTGIERASIISTTSLLEGISGINNNDGTIRLKLTMKSGTFGGNIVMFYYSQTVKSISFAAS